MNVFCKDAQLELVRGVLMVSWQRPETAVGLEAHCFTLKYDGEERKDVSSLHTSQQDSSARRGMAMAISCCYPAPVRS